MAFRYCTKNICLGSLEERGHFWVCLKCGIEFVLMKDVEGVETLFECSEDMKWSLLLIDEAKLIEGRRGTGMSLFSSSLAFRHVKEGREAICNFGVGDK